MNNSEANISPSLESREYRVEKTEDHLWTVQTKTVDDKWLGMSDHLTLQSACEQYASLQMIKLLDAVEQDTFDIQEDLDPMDKYEGGQIAGSNAVMETLKTRANKLYK